ncbi:hypothetical protein NPIL_511561, partial [Nephila pilipes]
MWVPERIVFVLVMFVCITSALETEVSQYENIRNSTESILENFNETECFCGENSIQCFFRKDIKKCICKHGFAQFNETCRECGCGRHGPTCTFDNDGNKKCVCNFGFGESRGKCVGK